LIKILIHIVNIQNKLALENNWDKTPPSLIVDAVKSIRIEEGPLDINSLIPGGYLSFIIDYEDDDYEHVGNIYAEYKWIVKELSGIYNEFNIELALSNYKIWQTNYDLFMAEQAKKQKRLAKEKRQKQKEIANLNKQKKAEAAIKKLNKLGFKVELTVSPKSGLTVDDKK